MELEANRSAGHPLAGISEMRPAEVRHPFLQQLQASLQAPHMQAQIQLHNQFVWFLHHNLLLFNFGDVSWDTMPPDLCQYS